MSSVQTSISKSSTSLVATTSTGWLSTLTALAFGAILVFAVGFAPMSVAHNAAHDVRHSMAFPCH
ncbi:MAG: CbtB domain-containing protein [Pseudomonadales bacterium]